MKLIQVVLHYAQVSLHAVHTVLWLIFTTPCGLGEVW